MFCSEEDAIQIDSHNGSPLLQCRIGNREKRAKARVVYQHVQTTECGLDFCERAYPIILECHIEKNGTMLSAVRLQCAGTLLQFVRGSIGDNDGRAFLCEAFRRRPTNARRTAGNECDLAGKPTVTS